MLDPNLLSSRNLEIDRIMDTYLTSNSTIYLGCIQIAHQLVDAVLQRVKSGQVTHVRALGGWVYGDHDFSALGTIPENFQYQTIFSGVNERAGFPSGLVSPLPNTFSGLSRVIATLPECGPTQTGAAIDVAFIQTTPPNNQGVCSIGPLGMTADAVAHAHTIVAQFNSQLPFVDSPGFTLPLERISAYIEHDEACYVFPKPVPTAEDRQIAQVLEPLIPDGSCIQLGIGSLPNAIGEALQTKRHLGAYTEMLGDTYMELIQSGAMDNSVKSYLPGTTVAGFAYGTEELYRFTHDNPGHTYFSYSDICNPARIALNDNLVSINTAIAVDLGGQVCAESIGHRYFSGTGGQLDFVRGSQMATGGRSFLAFSSVAHTKEGPVSKISATLAPGSVVTTPRSEVHYIATEFGCVNLRGCSVYERAKRLISIAHPDFRDQLAFDAKKAGLLV